MFNMISVNEKINVQDISAFELRHDIVLPKVYVDFLLKYNGGYSKQAVFQISPDEGKSLVNKFYGIGDMQGNLDRVRDNLDGEMPEGFISIGYDPAGNEICLGTKNSKYEGQVYFWMHDMESKREMDNMFLLNGDFTSFLDNLIEED
ncbi:SMI1/KNR4 family protein [Listeria newyorkensis]|uniref:SMI1/KNR4 family protein n=1 Tax=Listeria newyorkensis TaxID=1497681 RepID=A0A841YY95_9LIST|nr:SMI1/KNR4 family protein [Listeria newyorkensis]MBC1458841.1 SMI1/KNR4 family protein [Listeria newyorkensis]